jgi:hypothetical protein
MGKCTLEESIFKPARAFEETPEVVAADTERDELYNYIEGIIMTNCLAPVEEKRTAATALMFTVDNYKAIDRKPYAEETALVRNFVLDLQSAAKVPHVATLGLTEAVALLNTKNEAFDAKYGQRSVTNLSREVKQKMKEIRPEVDAAGSKMFDIIDALYLVNETVAKDATTHTDLAAMIDGLNAPLLWAKEILDSRKGGGKSGSGNKPSTDDDNGGNSGNNTDDGHQEAPEPNPGGGNNNNGGSDKPPNPESPD